MKRVIALILTVILAIGILSGCAVKIPDGMTGKDVSKLLLAKERMSEGVFSNPDGIFETGARDFTNLWQIADENLAKIKTKIASLYESLYTDKDEFISFVTEEFKKYEKEILQGAHNCRE